jgi:hypothetical protein
MTEADDSEKAPAPAPPERPLYVPVIRGGFDPVISRKFIGPLPDPLESLPDPEYWSKRRMWMAAGAVVLVSSVPLVWAFAPRAPEVAAEVAPTCKVVVVSETASSVVRVKLAASAGSEKVWVGNDRGVMQAASMPGDPNAYGLDTAGYLHEDIIGVYVGSAFCDGRFNLGSVMPGDEKFFGS